MSENIIKIPQGESIEGKEFYAHNLDEALKNCQDEGFGAVFMPELIDARISASKGDRVWNNWYCAPSLRATGRTKQGNAVVVYAHVLNYFSNPANITKAKKKLVNGAGVIPKNGFQMLLNLEDNENVFVVDYKTLRNSPSDVIRVKDALKHPQAIPFLGGEERAEKYLQRHKEVYGNNIGIWHCDDLGEKPLGRLLFVGGDYGSSLVGDIDLDLDGRFVGVHAKNFSTGNKGVVRPNLEKVLKMSQGFVPERLQEQFKKELKDLYK